MAMIAKNNAFGTGAPSWDLSFPAGALTAAEITAYCPHWLKSIDIINRFLCHGARTIHIAALLNEFRNFPDDRVFNTNSTLVMMSYAMRKAGFDGWTVTKHFDFTRDHFLPESGLNVTNFRTPCMTQPRNATSQGSNHSINQGVRPVAFKDLAKHVKKHPSGDDALDLARCVQYAVEHLDEVWLFPIDFQRLTAHLGGPATITPAHLDEQVFARRDDIKFPATKRKRSAAIKPTSNNKQPSSKPPTKMRKFINVLSTSGPSQPRKRGNDHLSKDTNSADGYEDGHEENEPFGQLAKKRKLPRGRSMFNSYVNDDEFLPDEAGTNGNIPTRDFSAPEQDELPQSEVDRSITLRKAREGKRAAVEPDTAAPQPDVEPNLGSPQFCFLDYDPVLNYFPSADRQNKIAPSCGQQSSVASGYAQQSNVASGHEQRSSFAKVRNQPSNLAPNNGQQRNFYPACGQSFDISSTYIQPSRHSSGHDQQPSFPSGHPQKADLTTGYGQRLNSILGPDQQLNLPPAYGQQTNLSSTSAQQPVLPFNHSWQPISMPDHIQQSFVIGNGQPSTFTTGHCQNSDPACNANQKSIFAPGYDPMEPNFAPNFSSSQLDSQFDFVPKEYEQPLSLDSTSGQVPLDIAPILDPNQSSFAPILDQIPPGSNPSFDQKSSDFNPSPAAQQAELSDLFEQYIQQYTESDVQLNTATTAVADTAATDSTIANTLPALLTPPIQPANHLQITEQNLHNYARRPFINISDMWNTALDYMRFDGPRQSAPYRELHTLGELNKNDISDWAENIRFAREQWVQFGTIWTEFEGHLEKIRKARLDWGWKSPEAIRVDANKASQAA